MKDAFAIVGFGLLVGGCAMYRTEIGLIVAGVLLLTAGIGSHLASRK